MTSTEHERPAEMSQADVTLVTRGITVQASVELSNALALVLRPTAEAYARTVGVKPGDKVELFWRDAFEERMLPAEVSSVEDGGALRWNLGVTGPAERSTRRKAVRARVEIPVRVRVRGAEVGGETVDISEAGLKAQVDGWGLAPEPGTPVEVDLDVEGHLVRCGPASSGRRSAPGAGCCRCSSRTSARRTRTGCAAGSSRRCARSAPAPAIERSRSRSASSSLRSGP